MAIERSEETAMEVILALPECATGLQFYVHGYPVPPCSGEKTVLWVRAREDGDDQWGQSSYVEIERACGNLFESRTVPSSALWLAPGRTYHFEVVPEGIENPSLQIICIKTPEKAPGADKEESVLDSPVLWLAVILAGLLVGMIAAMLRKGTL